MDDQENNILLTIIANSPDLSKKIEDLFGR